MKMPRIYSNYSANDMSVITNLAKELGFSLSAFQHYCVMLYADQRRNTTTPITVLITKMLQTLSDLERGKTFIVSALLPVEWPSLSRSDKMLLAKQLSLYIKGNPQQYGIYKRTPGQSNIYIKKAGNREKKKENRPDNH